MSKIVTKELKFPLRHFLSVAISFTMTFLDNATTYHAFLIRLHSRVIFILQCLANGCWINVASETYLGIFSYMDRKRESL